MHKYQESRGRWLEADCASKSRVLTSIALFLYNKHTNSIPVISEALLVRVSFSALPLQVWSKVPDVTAVVTC